MYVCMYVRILYYVRCLIYVYAEVCNTITELIALHSQKGLIFWPVSWNLPRMKSRDIMHGMS